MKEKRRRRKRRDRDGLNTRKIEIPYRLTSIQGNSISHLLNERLEPVLSNKRNNKYFKLLHFNSYIKTINYANITFHFIIL